MNQFKIALGVVAAACLPAASAPLYTNDFEVDTTASWTINHGPSDDASNFFFDYSSVGIPASPGGGGTRGMKLQANLTNGIFSGYSVSPTGQDFGTDFTLTFDWWANFNGPFPLGGSGSTNLSTFGVGTAGTAVQWPAVVPDSVFFAATLDGNSSVDWRAYSSGVVGGYPDASPVFFAGPHAGNRNNSDPYYAGFGGVMAPAAQLLLYPQQTGTTNVGSAGMEWHQVEISKVGMVVTWTVDGLPIAQVNDALAVFGGGNIFFGHSDTNSSSSSDVNDVNLLFTLVDNVVVTPEPGTLALLAAGGLALLRRRR